MLCTIGRKGVGAVHIFNNKKMERERGGLQYNVRIGRGG